MKISQDEKMKVIHATTDHIPDLIGLMKLFYAESNYTVNIEKAEEVFRRYIGSPSLGNVLVVVDDNNVVGYIIIKYVYTMSNYGYICSFEDLFVKQENRRKNAASALIERAIDIARSQGIRNYSLEVGADNIGAKKLYEKYGFKVRAKNIETMEKEEI